jgi:hypothetical protein
MRLGAALAEDNVLGNPGTDCGGDSGDIGLAALGVKVMGA